MESYFNSTMVRLKETAGMKEAAKEKFQFHYGAIKGHCAKTVYHLMKEFQFHYGAIKGRL